MGIDVRVVLLRAQQITAGYVPKVQIEINNTIYPDELTLDELDELFENQAKLLFDALIESLPIGTTDRLLIKLLERKKSLLVVK